MNHLFVAGFDFGTSYSKVVIRDQLTGKARAVTFGGDKLGLLPSCLRIKKNEILGPLSKGGLLLGYPKLLAADAAVGSNRFAQVYQGNINQISGEIGADNISELALLCLTRLFLTVIQGIREFIVQEDDWGSFNPDIDPVVIQLAVPSGLMADGDNKVDKLMMRALRAATYATLQNPRLKSDVSTSNELRSMIRNAGSLSSAKRELLDHRCITYPEVAAAVQTIFRSRNVPDGKFITMDVGAGTIDLNAFYRRTTNDPGLDYWACRVEPLGVARVNESLRSGKLTGDHETAKDQMSVGDLKKGIGKSTNELMADAFRFQPARVSGGGNPWTRGTFVYVWGGGAEFSAYPDSFETALKDLGVKNAVPLMLPLPADDFLLPPDIKNFGRLAVAYGLSYHQANLEEVLLPHQLKVFDELHPASWRDSLSHKIICKCLANPDCGRCHGTGFINPDDSIAPNFITASLSDQHKQSVNLQPSRYEKALVTALKYYNLKNRNPRRFFVVDRVIMLNHIYNLTKRPEVQGNETLMQVANSALQYNTQRFKGKARARSGSAQEVNSRVRAVLKGSRSNYDLEFLTDSKSTLVNLINNSELGEYVDFICGVSRVNSALFYPTVSFYRY